MKMRLISLLAVFCLLAAMVPALARAADGTLPGVSAKTPAIPTSGDRWDGSVLEPSKTVQKDWNTYYVITKCAELAYVAKEGGVWLTRNYILENDLILNAGTLSYNKDGKLLTSPSHRWTPIAKEDSYFFSGIFDGNGHTISGLYVDEDSYNAGLFGNAGAATIKNLTVVNGYVKGIQDVGGIVGRGAYCADCVFSGAVVGALPYSGDTLEISAQVGGIVGSGYLCTGCVFYGTVVSKGAGIGGIMGNTLYASITGAEDCVSYGTVSGEKYVGGVAGLGRAKRCVNYGTVSGTWYVGGVVGYGSEGLEHCANYGAVSGTDDVGGVVGDGSAVNCYNTAAVKGKDNVGGIVGNVSKASSNCYTTGSVTGTGKNIGAVAGFDEKSLSTANAKFSGCYYLRTTTVNAGLYGLGGFGDSETVSSDTEGFYPKRVDDLKQQATFDGWDFSTVWCINPSWNDGYPHLAMEIDLVGAPGTTYSITIDPDIEHGGVTADKTSAKKGDTVTLTITPDKGYQLKELTVTPELTLDGSGSARTFTMPENDMKISAVFEPAPLTGTVAVTGRARSGETLTASVTGSNNTGTLSYQWKADGEPITDAKGESYTLTDAEVGKKITCEVESDVQTGSITSKEMGPVAKVYAITIDPDIEDGSVTADKTTATAGETVTLTVTPDKGYQLKELTVTPELTLDGSGSTRTFTMPEKDVEISAVFEFAPLTGTVAIAGTAHSGETLAASVTESNNTGTLSYQWKADGEPITGATGETYVLTDNEVGKKITCEVKSDVQTGSITSEEMGPVTKMYGITIDPDIEDGSVSADKDSAEAGETVTLTVTPDKGYQLKELTVTPDTVVITDNTFTMPESDVEISAVFEPAPLRGTVAITGTARSGQTLTASVTGSNNTGTLSYQWNADGEPITDAKGKTYTLTDAEVGKKITCEVKSDVQTGSITSEETGPVAKVYGITIDPDIEDGSVSADKDSAEAGETVTLTVTPDKGYQLKELTATPDTVVITDNTFTMPENDVKISAVFEPAPLTGDVAITGTARSGQTLTASVTGSNNTGTLSYQWNADGEPITDAKGKTYTLTDAEVGKKITCIVMSDVQTGSITSEETEPVVSADASDPVSYTVTFDMDGHGTAPEAQTVRSGGKATKPADPTADGYTFGGWFKDAEKTTVFDFDSEVITADTVIYAKWTEDQSSGGDSTTTYTITIASAANGSVTTDKTTAKAGETVTLTISPNSGYSLSTITTTPALTLNGSGNTRTFTMPDSNVTVSATFAVNSSASALTGYVDIEGEPWVGETLRAVVWSTNNTGVLYYQWTADGYNLYGETSRYLDLTRYEVGKVIRCVVTSSVQTGSITGRLWGTVDYYDSRYYPSSGSTNNNNSNTSSGASQNGNSSSAGTGNDSVPELPIFTTATNTDGTKTTTINQPDGSSGLVAMTSFGTVSAASMTFSNDAYANALRTGSTLTIPATVNSSRSASSATPVRIVLPQATGSVKVKIPVSQMTAGTVAVIENAFGPDTVVKSSVLGGDGVVFELTGSAVVKIVDNTKSFLDVFDDAWYGNAVRWASSREVMNGVSPQMFDPQGTMNRAMMTQMLYNYDDAANTGVVSQFSDVSSRDWYADSVSWATKNGIARNDGGRFGAEDALTREDMAVMLYNYAKVKGYSTSASGSTMAFPDNGDVSDWARTAMQWAVGAGLINGTQNGTRTVILDPQGTVTRAQLATIMQRFNNLY